MGWSSCKNGVQPGICSTGHIHVQLDVAMKDSAPEAENVDIEAAKFNCCMSLKGGEEGRMDFNAQSPKSMKAMDDAKSLLAMAFFAGVGSTCVFFFICIAGAYCIYSRRQP